MPRFIRLSFVNGCRQPDMSGVGRLSLSISEILIRKRKCLPSTAHWQRTARRIPFFYEDEVDIDLNPKIGADWQRKGQQNRIPTSGKNEKHYLDGALHAGTGRVDYVSATREDSDLFIQMLNHLKSTYRSAKTITVIVDNYIIHKSKKTQRWLKRNT